MHEKARAAGDVLPRNVLHISLDRVLERQTVAGSRLEIELELTLRIERRGTRLELLLRRQARVVATADEREAIERVPFGDRCRWVEAWVVNRRPAGAPRRRPVRARPRT